jgi:hypothetical protein
MYNVLYVQTGVTGHLLEHAPANTYSLAAERQTQMERSELKRIGVGDQELTDLEFTSVKVDSMTR